MKYTLRLSLAIAFISILQYSIYGQNKKEAVLWKIDSSKEWKKNDTSTADFNFEKGMVSGEGIFKSKKKKLNKATKLSSITLEQSPVWNNWKEVKHVGPSNLKDAPVFLALKDKDYWVFGRYGELKGDDPFQTNGKGSEAESLKGYHAWHSTDMVHWVHHGSITDWEARWMTTGEHVDRKFYFYADVPNDTDPHLIIDDNIYDGKMGKKVGMVYDDGPGSDMAIMRDLDGTFHLISENWGPINASLIAWDSPLADHAVSPDGMGGGDELSQVINKVQKWAIEFPVADVLIGNHDRIIMRKAFDSAIPKVWIKSYNDVLGTNWNWQERVVYDGVQYTHGEGGTARTRAKNDMMSSVGGHVHTQAYVEWMVGRKFRIFSMQVGCGVDSKSYAAAYAKNLKKQDIGCGVVLGGHTAINCLMEL